MTALTSMLELQSQVTAPIKPLTLDLLTLLWRIRDEHQPGSHKLACDQLAKSILDYQRKPHPLCLSPFNILKRFSESPKIHPHDVQLVVQMAVERLQGVYADENS